MKRGTLLKSLFGLAFALVMANGAFAQIPADFVSIGDPATGIDSVTVGSTTPYWVLPDSYFHPTFTADGTLTADFIWNWSVTGAATLTNTSDNYTQVIWPATPGSFTLRVNEQAPALYGGCTSPDTSIRVNVIASPTVAFSADNPGTIIGADLNVCEGDGDLDGIVQAAITSVAGGSPEVQLQYSILVETIDDGGNASTVGALSATYQKADGSQITGINGTTYDLTKPAAGYIAIDGGSGKETTVYTYTISGVNDRISRKSEYIANSGADATLWTFYDNAPETITIRVNPAPTTGPIFHIPNSWAN